MKRNCLNTNEPFKRGHVRDDGFVFFAYTKVIKADGFFKEIWLSPAASENIKTKDRDQKKAKYQRKSQRHLPGFTDLPLSIRQACNKVKILHDENEQYKDITTHEAALTLADFDLSPEEWDIVKLHAGKVNFNLDEAIKEIFNN